MKNKNYQLAISRYPLYKYSGVEWLGEVPEHWEVKKFNHIAEIVEGQVNPKEEPYKDYILVAPNHIESGTGRLLYKETASDQSAESGKYLFHTDDVIYSKIRPALKKVWKANFLGICSADMYPIRLLKGKIDPNYFVFLCLAESFSNFMIATSMRVAMPKVNRDDFHECHFLTPPLAEQKAIAYYLDTKTAQIDRKIDLLTQKASLYGKLKQSLINETVTRGLDKTVPMKDGGIKWLGEVPEHWDVKRVKELSTTISKGTTPSTEGFIFVDEGIRFIKAENISHTKIISKFPAFYINEEANEVLSRSKLKLKDLLIVIAGATIGKIGVVDEGLLPANTNQAVCFVRFKRFVNVDFLYYLFVSDYFSKYLWYSIVQSAQPNLSMGVLGNFLLFGPNTPEQKAIADYLDTKTAQIDQIIQTINTQIEKLKELRKTLINDVVTGKIKV